MRFAWVAQPVFLIAAELLAAFILVLAASHASAQFFFDNRFANGPARSGRTVQQQPQWFWPSQQWQQWQPRQQSVPRHVPRRPPRVKEVNEQDCSKAPPARKRDSPTSRVVVMGDSMADWLAYGLEEALSKTYIDVWDGFVDEDGDFALYGPDFEGQTRRLRTSDGAYFTKAGALKLGHYVERELRRMMLARPAPVGLPAPELPQTQAPSPLAGPVVALTPTESNPDELLGDKPSKPLFADSITTRVLVRGEPIVAPPGRADDFAWPRRESVPGPATSEATLDPGSPMLPTHASPMPKRLAAVDHVAHKAGRKHPPKHAMPRSLERPPWQFGATERFSAFWPIGPSR